MSAWLCSESHIALLASKAPNPVKAFALLKKENIRSLSARYPGRDFLAEWKRDARKYKYSAPCVDVSQTFLVKQCDCFDYQACESDDYRKTKAAALVTAIRAAAIAQGGRESGAEYDAAPWGID